jgi:hypothetical protein
MSPTLKLAAECAAMVILGTLAIMCSGCASPQARFPGRGDRQTFNEPGEVEQPAPGYSCTDVGLGFINCLPL